MRRGGKIGREFFGEVVVPVEGSTFLFFKETSESRE